MNVKVAVPGHITCFFSLHYHDDPLLTGSRGCGIVIDKGVITSIEIKGNEKRIETSIDGKAFPCPVSASVASKMLSIAGVERGVEIRHELGVPMKQGFGTSGAGALGVAVGLNEALSLDLGMGELGRISHVAEVENRTGMGDVPAILRGGVVVRKREGAPGMGETVSLPLKGGLFSFVLGRGIDTKGVLEDASKRERITRMGDVCLEEFLEAPSKESLIKSSRRFAYDTMLARGKVKGAIEKLEEHGIEASMVMLGNSVFGFSESPEEVGEVLEGDLLALNVDASGPKVIEGG